MNITKQKTRLDNFKQYETTNINKVYGGIKAVGISNEDDSDSE